MKVAVIHGPNLNLLGSRQPEIYGDRTLADLEAQIKNWAESTDIRPHFFQSNDESALVEAIHRAADTSDAILINPGGFTHTSVAIADAVASISLPTIEVHLSDIAEREPWRRESLIAPVAVRQISGRGPIGYRDALRHLINRTEWPFETTVYGPHDDNIADLRLPDGESKAMVILVHGGFWLNPWERDSLDTIAVALAKDGYSTLNVEYRRTPSWPASGHDVATVIQDTRRQNDRLALIGHSAGGYLGMWGQSRQPVDLFIGLAPITDLERAKAESRSVGSLVSSGAPLQVGMAGTPGLLLHGKDDDVVDPAHSLRLNGETEVEIVPDTGHFDVLDPSRPHWNRVRSELEAAFRQEPGQTELPHPERTG